VGLSLVTPPAAILTLEEAKGQVRVNDSAEDALIQSYMAAAESSVEAYLNRSLLTQRWQYTLDEFPCGDCILLPRPNLLSVISVQYVDPSGATQTWSSSNYVVLADRLPGEIALAYGVFWPQTRYQKNAVTITYDAGYGDVEEVPPPIISAMKMVLSDLYTSREANIIGDPVVANPAVKNLLDYYRYREAA